MRNFDGYEVKSTIVDTERHCVISLGAYAENTGAAEILCFYMKGNGTLVIDDIETAPGYRRSGLGLLGVHGVLKILGEKNLQVNRCLASHVEGYPSTDEAGKIAESFFKSLGFEQFEEHHWGVDGETLKKRLEEKMQE